MPSPAGSGQRRLRFYRHSRPARARRSRAGAPLPTRDEPPLPARRFNRPPWVLAGRSAHESGVGSSAELALGLRLLREPAALRLVSFPHPALSPRCPSQERRGLLPAAGERGAPPEGISPSRLCPWGPAFYGLFTGYRGGFPAPCGALGVGKRLQWASRGVLP